LIKNPLSCGFLIQEFLQSKNSKAFRLCPPWRKSILALVWDKGWNYGLQIF
jgi:hypothetical protein